MKQELYIPLRIFSSYSIGKSNIRFEDLINLLKKYDIPAIGITDKDNLFGALEHSLNGEKAGIQVITGITLDIIIDTDIDIEECNLFHDPITGQSCNNNDIINIALIARTQEGYSNLLTISSMLYVTIGEDCSIDPIAGVSTPNPIKLSSIKKLSAGLTVIWGISDQKYKNLSNYSYENSFIKTNIILRKLSSIFGINDICVELIRYSDRSHIKFEKILIECAQELSIPIIASNIVTHLSPSEELACDVMMCISSGQYLSTNERESVNPSHYLKSCSEMFELFADIPEALENTVILAQRCNFMPKGNKLSLPQFTNEVSEDELLKKNATEGLRARMEKILYKYDPEVYWSRLEYELNMLSRMGFSGYFLIVADFITWSRLNDIPVGPGRGSAVGSIVAWALRITDLDPIRFNLLFERFLNPERVSMPDIDTDFCQLGRDRVIEYVKEKYGNSRVAHIITFGKLQPRAVLKDVGRVIGMSYYLIDRICKMIPNNPANPINLSTAVSIDTSLQSMIEDDEDVRRLISIGLQLEGMIRHVSTHGAGIVISSIPLIKMMPLYQESGSVLVQFNMKYTESAGVIKFDFLGLKTLTMIKQTCDLVKNLRKIDIDLELLPLDDEKTFKMLAQGLTVGVFQFEGAGMREAMKGMVPENIEDLIALGSLYRPGPMANIPSYNRRKNGIEEVLYIHPMLKDLLKETYGIIIYQEQVIQIGQIIAGYSLGEADILRRAMGKKDKEEMAKQKDLFIKRAIDRGIEKENAQEIFDTVDKFASYGFNKSHAAAYAIIAYRTAYLKAHYPAEFLTTLMNLDMSNNIKLGIYCNEAKSLEIELLAPSINESSDCFIVVKTEENTSLKQIRYGLAAIKGIGSAVILEIIKERNENGKFSSLNNFLKRTSKIRLDKKTFEQLAKSGAFNELYNNQNELIENCSSILDKYSEINSDYKGLRQMSLFSNENEDDIGSILKMNQPTYFEKAAFEYSSLGFYLNYHPIALYRKDLNKIKAISIEELEGLIENQSDTKNIKPIIAGVITSIKLRSSQNKEKQTKFAFIQLCDESGMLDIAIFDDEMLDKNKDILTDGAIIVTRLNISKDDVATRIIAQEIYTIESIDHGIGSIVFLIEEINNGRNSIESIIGMLNLCKDGEGGEYVRIAIYIENKLLIMKSKKKYFISEGIINSVKNSKLKYIKYSDFKKKRIERVILE